MRKRIVVGGVWHETNTFATGRTRLEDFKAYQFAEGGEILARYRGVRNEVGGIIDGAGAHDLELVPVLYAAAVPSAIVAAETFEHICEQLVQGIRTIPDADGVLVVLHGAMVVEGFDDADEEILRRVREAAGPTLRVVATFDIHANLAPAMVAHADLLIGYDTYPHVDVYDRGFEAAAVMRQLFDRAATPTAVLEKLPLLSPPQAQNTSEPPMQPVMDRLHEIEADGRVVSASVAVGYPYADVPRAGMSVLVTTWDDRALAATYAHALRGLIWDQRRAFRVSNVPPDEAVRRAVRASAHPVILVDVADNIGGGAPGDGTVLLRELLAANARRAVVTMTDPEAVARASAAGIGAEVALRVGGKTDSHHGMPVDVRGRVRLMSTGEYVHKGSYMTGQVTRMGRTVVLDCDGLDLVLMERKAMPFDAQQLRSLGIEPAGQRVIVVKSAIAWQAAYGNLAREVIYVDTPGVCTSNLNTLPYARVSRPISPLDPM